MCRPVVPYRRPVSESESAFLVCVRRGESDAVAAEDALEELCLPLSFLSLCVTLPRPRPCACSISILGVKGVKILQVACAFQIRSAVVARSEEGLHRLLFHLSQERQTAERCALALPKQTDASHHRRSSFLSSFPSFLAI